MTIDKKKLAIQLLAVIGLILSIKSACIYYVANYEKYAIPVFHRGVFNNGSGRTLAWYW